MGNIRVIEKKLGRHRVKRKGHFYYADGFAYLGENKIEIDPRISPKRKLKTHVHELWHIITGDDRETGAYRAERMANVLWKMGYRQLPKRFRD